MNAQRNKSTDYSVGEEIANSITHGIGVLLAIIGLVAMMITAGKYGTASHIVSSSIFGATLILLYLASTLYHSIPGVRVKQILKTIDHSAIFLLIAGSYTPFVLVSLRGAWGWSLFGTIWGLAIAGIVIQLTPLAKIKVLSVGLYLAMGWVAIIAVKPMVAALNMSGFTLLLLGGITYSIGVIFYAWKKLPYGHAIWHLFVLGGSIFHFFTVYYYVIPHS